MHGRSGRTTSLERIISDNGQAADLFYRHLDFDYESNDHYENPANGDTTLPN